MNALSLYHIDDMDYSIGSSESEEMDSDTLGNGTIHEESSQQTSRSDQSSVEIKSSENSNGKDKVIKKDEGESSNLKKHRK